MIAYVGYSGKVANVGRTHASVATAAAALAKVGGDMLGAINLLIGARPSYPPPPMKVFALTSHRAPVLPLDADLAIVADLERYALDFYTVVGDPDAFWSPVGTLQPDFPLIDVESIESLLALSGRPNRRAIHRRLRLVRGAP